jgi:hypothetical protein
MADVRQLERAHSDLSLTFEGPGVDAGTMDVRSLAPALLALGAVFQEANRITNPSAPDVALEIRATSEGSFHIDLQLALDTGMSMLVGGPIAALANLKTVVIDPVVGLIAYLRRRHSEPDAEATEMPGGDISITWVDGTTVIYPGAVARISRNVTVRREIQNVVKPIESGEVDEVRLGSSSVETITITRDDLAALALTSDTEEPIEQNTVVMTLAVVAPAFDGKKWRVSDGTSSFWVSITDPSFAEQIDAGEQFAKGDYLRSRVRFKQFQTEDGLRMEREVIEVLEHRGKPAPPAQLDL